MAEQPHPLLVSFRPLFSVLFPLAMQGNVPARLCLCTMINLGYTKVNWRPF